MGDFIEKKMLLALGHLQLFDPYELTDIFSFCLGMVIDIPRLYSLYQFE